MKLKQNVFIFICQFMVFLLLFRVFCKKVDKKHNCIIVNAHVYQTPNLETHSRWELVSVHFWAFQLCL